MEESRLKIKSVTITGMHKVDKKTYTFNDDITYFIGQNGSGKSTILEATQLALLGYIPGYAKTNESIMKHSSGRIMSVEAELEDNIKITRTWIRSGSSVKSTTDVSGYDGELSDLLGKVDLPVFDFNEFKSMTANKLKDWFISFLPSTSGDLDIRKELNDAISSRSLPSSQLVDDIVTWCETTGLSGLELIRKLNEKFKEDQSFVKGQISKLEGTIQSLIKYDDEPDCDDEDLRNQIATLESLKSEVMQYEAAYNVHKKAQDELNSLKGELSSGSIDDNPEVKRLKSEIAELSRKNDVLKADYHDLEMQVVELQGKKSALTKAGNNCPYTNEFCQTAHDLAEKVREQAAEIDKQIQFKKDEMKECDPSLQSVNDRAILKLQSELGSIQSKYDRLVAMQIHFENSTVPEKPSEKSAADIDAEIRMLSDKLVKVEANKRYNELSEKVIRDKFNLENELEIYKIWTKLTDANGLQTKLMNKPFESLEEEMSNYLTDMFNKPTKAKFNLVSKANSFSFGLDHEGNYIEFDYLSSGERCLFTLALIMCILDKSESKIRTILVDDILDHLDASNASYSFSALKNVKDIQFILAGVKECEDSSICKSV